jgi:DNA-binding response OmpR family regulator
MVTKKTLIKKMGWECIVAVSYDEAVEVFKKNNPDMVITEILILDHMNRNGITLVEELRQIENPKPKKTPIIIFSDLDDEESFEKALKSGATSCLSKNNISLDEFINDIQQYLVG